jgi:hypothetical protein
VRLIPIADLGIKHAPPSAKPGKSAEPCLLCGRWILDPSAARIVEITTDGCIVWPGDGTAASVPNSQGGFPVGSNCYAKIKRSAKA